MSDEKTAPSTKAKVVVATTVALSFISFWRGAAIVLSDLASSMFYAGGIAEQAIGRSAPWFVLAVMLFSFAVRAVYLESCSMFVRGGVYRVVLDSMGRVMARLSVSALIFDYLLTGPISSVSAGHYIGGLYNETVEQFGILPPLNVSSFAVVFALITTCYFWWSNIQGIHESSSKALRILQVTTIMVVILLIWCMITLFLRGGAELPPAPLPRNFQFGEHALGWFEGTFWHQLAGVAVFIAFGHAFLSLSGFETLAQVYREIAYPKMKNLRITAAIVCFYALLSTGLITLLASMIIPLTEHSKYRDNLIGGLAQNLVGPGILRLAFHFFVVIVGALILSGAVNTAIIGANSVLNRIAEDGVLLNWFRRPHKNFGTTYRIINCIVVLQLCTILLSKGDVYLLGEAYAFGVVWSFFLKACGVLVLRYQRNDQEYKVPFNLRIANVELPIGLFATTLVLFMVALANLFSKQAATIYGFSFTILLFLVFTISERVNAKLRDKKNQSLEEFNLSHQPEVSTEALKVEPEGILVAVRDYTNLIHLQWVFDKTRYLRRKIIVVTIRPLGGAGEYELADEQFFSHYEQELFSHVVQLAEKEGRTVQLLVVPATNPVDALVQTAGQLKVNLLVTGVSSRMTSEDLARQIGLAWEALPEPRHPFSLAVIARQRPTLTVNLGPHTTRLWPEDLNLVHELWLDLSHLPEIGARLHHRDVIALALRRLKIDLGTDKRQSALRDLNGFLEQRETTTSTITGVKSPYAKL